MKICVKHSAVYMVNNIMLGHSVVGVGEELTMEMFSVCVGDVDDA